MKFRPYYGSLMLLCGIIWFIWLGNTAFFPLLLIIFGIYFITSKYIYVFRAIKASKTNPCFLGHIDLEIDDVGISWRGVNSNGSFQWDALIGYRKFTEGFLLYPQRNLFYIIPIKYLDEGKKNQVSSILKYKLKQL